mmetsp:Transcript_121171/g.210690  ORF Transcript_121171/g.210690 Transcript_121171/m.210690 type:complete len:92 (+) Transcript_121171:2590-2865(+)
MAWQLIIGGLHSSPRFTPQHVKWSTCVSQHTRVMNTTDCAHIMKRSLQVVVLGKMGLSTGEPLQGVGQGLGQWHEICDFLVASLYTYAQMK